MIPRLLGFFYRHLYHGLAFTYDLVAWLVSFGQWNAWIRTVLPFIEGTRVLELGHGPGHLQHLLRDRAGALQSRETLESAERSLILGLDESAQMGLLARRRLLRFGYAQTNLARGLGQNLPFPARTFDCLLSTFPSEYIFDARTLAEAWRTLKNGGRLVVLPAAWPGNPLLKWLYRVTGESPSEALEIVKSKMIQPFLRAGFRTSAEFIEVKSGLLLLVVAEKSTEEK